jgi:hypothetical protein
MLELGKQHDFHVFTVKYSMPGHDVWNPHVVSKCGVEPKCGVVWCQCGVVPV